MWKYLGESVIGTAHRAGGLPCQDAYRLLVQDGVLIAVVADGAGSALHAEQGAQTTCECLRDAVVATLKAGTALEREAVLGWFRQARQELERVAAVREAGLRDLACTVLLAVVGAETAVFAQVGDGAIVVADAAGFAPVFWPEPGEYANVCDFLTDDAFEERLLVEVRPTVVAELALFSDGLQRLALDYATRRGHPGFFGPLFVPLRGDSDPEALRAPLRAVLDSPLINQRTDDDKTLLLAARRPA